QANIVRHQGRQDLAVLNADDPLTADLPHESRTSYFSLDGPANGAWFDGAQLWLGGATSPLLDRKDLKLRGLHNVANALAAAAIATAIGCQPAPIQAALRRFQPVPHRLEVVDTVDGITYINDSIA